MIAKTLADEFCGYFNLNGRNLVEECEKLCIQRKRNEKADMTKYVFEDGSVITVASSGWDIGFLDCWCWQGEGHTCQ
jgi:hypothetical protein